TDVLSLKWSLSGEQFDVHDRQAVLIAVFGNAALKGFRCCVNWRDAAHQARRAGPLQTLYQPEVGHFDPAGHEEQVSRLDIKVLEIMALDHEIEAVRRIAQITE